MNRQTSNNNESLMQRQPPPPLRQFGLSADILAQLPTPEALDLLKQAGFVAVELHAQAGALGQWMTDPAAFGQTLRRSGLQPWSVHCPDAGYNMADDDETTRLAAVRAAATSFPAARDLGASLVVCHVNAPGKPFLEADYQASLTRSRRSLETLAQHAADAGVRMAVETMIPRPHKRPGQRVAELLELIRGLGDHVGICIDTGHCNARQANLPHEIASAGDRLFNVHINDNHAQADNDEHLLPGQGTINWNEAMSALDAARFASPRIIEVNLLPGDDGHETMTRLADIIRAWQAMP